MDLYGAKPRFVQRGIHISPIAPYGYLKDPYDKHRLIPGPKTASIVQRIFALVASGTSTEKAAEILNIEEIPTPSKAKEGTSNAHANWHLNYWRRATINWIIVADRHEPLVTKELFARTQERLGGA